MKRKNPPIAAVIGRSNVGKSTLFNRIVGHRKANILDTPGLTRDRNYAMTEWNGKHFLLVDTGGYDPLLKDDIANGIREQVLLAVEEADSIILSPKLAFPTIPLICRSWISSAARGNLFSSL